MDRSQTAPIAALALVATLVVGALLAPASAKAAELPTGLSGAHVAPTTSAPDNSVRAAR